jgi:hypothetical protein
MLRKPGTRKRIFHLHWFPTQPFRYYYPEILPGALNFVMELPNQETPSKLFSLEEANRLVPTLRRLIKQVVQAQEGYTRVADDIERARDRATSGGGSHMGGYYIQCLAVFSKSVHDIEALGVLVKDYRVGLCDFPHLRDGRVVYLCWKMDEDEVRWWHDIEAGFAGRQPL